MERIKLNLIPSGVAPIVHLSQYDDGRKFGIDLFEGESVYVLDGTETLTVNSRKPDGHVVVLTVTNTGTSSLDVDTVEQLTAVHGVSYAKLKIEKGSVTIATLPFLIDVSRDPLENGDPSESFIQNLATQIAEGVAEEVATQYDSANVIFDNEPTDNHGIGYTVTSEGIKNAIDNAFDYDNTASGSLVHITDGADNIPVKSLVSQIVAVQSGSGTPSPSNPRAISGFDSGVITRCGANFIGIGTQLNGYANLSTQKYATNENAYGYYFPTYALPDKITFNATSGNRANVSYFNTIPASGVDAYEISQSSTLPRTITVNKLYKFIHIQFSYNQLVSDIMVNGGETALPYVPYNGNTYTFAFGQTVYGGHFDNKGNLVVTHGYIELDGTETSITRLKEHTFFIRGVKFNDTPVITRNGVNAICNSFVRQFPVDYESISDGQYLFNSSIISAVNKGFACRIDSVNDTVEDFRTWLTSNHVQIVYPLETPITLSITSQDIPTLLGENNIFSNCGDVEVTYYTSKSNDILEFVDSEIGKKNGTNIPIEANSPDSIKDYVDNEVSTITTSLSNKADSDSVYTKTESLYCPPSHDFTSETTSSDAILWFINTYGTKPMSFGFVVTGLGWFECFLTFYSDSQGGGILLLNGSSRLWAVTYINGVITLTEK